MTDWITIAISGLGSLAGAFGGTYLAKIGEIRAINRNLDSVVEQNRRIAAGTEAIKATLTDELWNKQQRHQIKKETLFSLASKLAAAGRSFRILFEINEDGPTPGDTKPYKEAVKGLSNCFQDLEDAMVLAQIVCDTELGLLLREVKVVMKLCILTLSGEKPLDIFSRYAEFDNFVDAIGDAIRKELKLD